MNLLPYSDRNTSHSCWVNILKKSRCPMMLRDGLRGISLHYIYLFRYYYHKFITKTKHIDLILSFLHYITTAVRTPETGTEPGVNVVTCVDFLINSSLLERETLQYLLRQTSPLNLAAHAVRMCSISLIQSWSHCALSSELCMNPTWVKN